MQPPQPHAEHLWLAKLAGHWNFESDCSMGPDQPPTKSTGTIDVRILGGLWFFAEMSSPGMPGGDPWTSIWTIGYDPASGKFIGTFVGSMMTHLWHYNGSRSGDTLTLDTVGPRFDGSGMGDYQDIVTIHDDNHWSLSSQFKLDDGTWVPFMKSDHRRA